MAKFVVALFLIVHAAFAQESPHGKIKFECATCHSTETWKIKKNTFHHEGTGFALTGSHKNVQCASCHKGLKFGARKSSDCLSCHTDVHKSELGTNCLRCHTTQTWKIADMVQKHQSTRFPLLGKHSTLNCQTCHANAAQKQYAGTSTDCFSCHQNAFVRAEAPNHTASGFSANCVQCHQVTAFTWSAGFRHDLTQFPLTGAHVATSCFNCHKNQVFKSTPTQCVSCHRPQFNSAQNPNHVLGNFSPQCQTCHTASAWQPAQFDHGTTRFALTGRHTSTQCQLCHVNNNYQLVYTNCVQCHQTQYAQPTNPRHVLPGFAHTCVPCHTTTVWRPSTFSHANTTFQLVGAHQAVTCNQCHVNNQYQLPHTCWDCHTPNFNNATNPNHQQGQFSHDCLTCHAQTAWRPATFNHSTTRFPLTGVHTTTACATCHVSGNYQLQYANCYQCHATKFTQPTNPDHVTSQFSYDCTPCHTTTAWRPSTFNHDGQYFRIYSGKHRGKWTTCSQCHPTVGQYQTFTCLSCHEHNQTSMDQKHLNKSGYSYLSPACYSCHRNA